MFMVRFLHSNNTELLFQSLSVHPVIPVITVNDIVLNLIMPGGRI